VAATSSASCEVLGFSNGSIIVDYILLFLEIQITNSSELSSAILSADSSTGALSLDAQSVVIIDISAFCEIDSCLNGATCAINAMNQIECTCAEGYSGGDCGTVITTPDASTVTQDAVTPTAVAATGLSTGAIVGIAVGSVVAAIIIVAVIALVVVKCSGRSKVAAQPDPDEIPLQEN
jgi:hypothetical protein